MKGDWHGQPTFKDKFELLWGWVYRKYWSALKTFIEQHKGP